MVSVLISTSFLQGCILRGSRILIKERYYRLPVRVSGKFCRFGAGSYINRESNKIVRGTNMEITVREAVADDADSLAELNVVVQELHYRHHPSCFREADMGQVADWFRRMLTSDRAHIWLAEADSSPAGYVLAIEHSREGNPFCLPRTCMEIDQIAVREDMQRKGIATRLMEQVRRKAIEKGIGTLELSSWAFNTGAQDAFRRMGFEPRVTRFGMEIENDRD
jgi:GNAT superfamily N-acetyltransferase